MTVESFPCDKMAILLHKRLFIYDTNLSGGGRLFSVLGDSKIHTVELNWGEPLYHKPPPSPMYQDAYCQMLCLYSYVWPHNDKICEFTPFQARKGGF